jgi:glycosyltransferase involved in cell wall biosynthesis
VVLYVGRLAEEKRLEELMDEFAAGTAGIDGSLLVLAGGGRLEGALARRAERLGLADRVRVLTALNGDELGLWYSAADINVSASRSETGPLTVVEAMACGTPTVAFDGPGFEDRVVDGVNGILVEDRPGALGKAIGRVLADSGLRERLSLGATERAGLYSVGAVTDRLLGMYEAALR